MPPSIRRPVLLLVASLIAVADGIVSPARADEIPAAPCAAPPLSHEEACACARSFFADYVPAVPIGPSRATFTTLVMPPVPWGLTDGEAGTPACGRVAFNLSRLSDERQFTNADGLLFRFDGEEQLATIEAVSPRLRVGVGACRDLAFHVAGSVTAYTLNGAWFDGLRNLVEETIGQADQGIRDAHGAGGRELSITDAADVRTDLLDGTPMWKARVALKFPLPDVGVGRHALSSAWSVGVTAPAFGGHADSGNDAFALDTTLALALPLSERFRLTGAVNLALPGRSRTLDDFGIDHAPLVAGGVVSLEWWISRSVAVAVGLCVNGPYTRDSAMPTDLTSYYATLGVLWRVSERTEVHVLFAENPGTKIAVYGDADTDYGWDTQRDADFSLTFGGSLRL